MFDVITFGEILWDIYSDPKNKGLLHRKLGGAPANVAISLARLGLKSAVIGGVGSDSLGDALVSALSHEGVDTRLILRYPNRTGLTFVTTQKSGEPQFLFYRDRTADMAVRAKDITPVMGRARWVLLGTSTLIDPELTKATVRWLETARTAGAFVALDLNVRAHLWSSARQMTQSITKLVRSADLIKASNDDLSAVGGLRWLAQTAPHATLVLTNRSGPARAIGAHGDIEARTKSVRCVDATGAGDAFIAGVLAALIAAKSTPKTRAWKSPHAFERALKIGHLLGAKAVSKVGAVTGIVDLGECKRLLKSA